MQIGIIILLTVAIGIILMLVQRSERKRRLMVAIGMLLIGEIIRRYIWDRSYHAEGWIALIAIKPDLPRFGIVLYGVL